MGYVELQHEAMLSSNMRSCRAPRWSHVGLLVHLADMCGKQNCAPGRHVHMRRETMQQTWWLLASFCYALLPCFQFSALLSAVCTCMQYESRYLTVKHDASRDFAIQHDSNTCFNLLNLVARFPFHAKTGLGARSLDTGN